MIAHAGGGVPTTADGTPMMHPFTMCWVFFLMRISVPINKNINKCVITGGERSQNDFIHMFACAMQICIICTQCCPLSLVSGATSAVRRNNNKIKYMCIVNLFRQCYHLGKSNVYKLLIGDLHVAHSHSSTHRIDWMSAGSGGLVDWYKKISDEWPSWSDLKISTYLL